MLPARVHCPSVHQHACQVHEHGQLHNANPLTMRGIAYHCLHHCLPLQALITKLTSTLHRVRCYTCSTLGPRLTIQPSSGNGRTAHMKEISSSQQCDSTRIL